MKYKNYIYVRVVLLFIIFTPFYGCGKLVNQDILRKNASEKAKSISVSLDNLKEGRACKYIGFIGDNSVFMARKNGKIKFMLFNYTGGNFLQTCTYVYGK